MIENQKKGENMEIHFLHKSPPRWFRNGIHSVLHSKPKWCHSTPKKV